MEAQHETDSTAGRKADAREFARYELRMNPDLQYDELKAKAALENVVVHPIVFGRVKRELGLAPALPPRRERSPERAVVPATGGSTAPAAPTASTAPASPQSSLHGAAVNGGYMPPPAAHVGMPPAADVSAAAPRDSALRDPQPSRPWFGASSTQPHTASTQPHTGQPTGSGPTFGSSVSGGSAQPGGPSGASSRTRMRAEPPNGSAGSMVSGAGNLQELVAAVRRAAEEQQRMRGALERIRSILDAALHDG